MLNRSRHDRRLRHYDVHLCGSVVGVVCSDDGSGVGGDGVGRATSFEILRRTRQIGNEIVNTNNAILEFLDARLRSLRLMLGRNWLNWTKCATGAETVSLVPLCDDSSGRTTVPSGHHRRAGFVFCISG